MYSQPFYDPPTYWPPRRFLKTRRKRTGKAGSEFDLVPSCGQYTSRAELLELHFNGVRSSRTITSYEACSQTHECACVVDFMDRLFLTQAAFFQGNTIIAGIRVPRLQLSLLGTHHTGLYHCNISMSATMPRSAIALIANPSRYSHEQETPTNGDGQTKSAGVSFVVAAWGAVDVVLAPWRSRVRFRDLCRHRARRTEEGCIEGWLGGSHWSDQSPKKPLPPQIHAHFGSFILRSTRNDLDALCPLG